MCLVWVANFNFSSPFAFSCLCQHSAIYQKPVAEMWKFVWMEGEWECTHMRAHRYAYVEAPDGMKKRRHRKACKSVGVDATWTSGHWSHRPSTRSFWRYSYQESKGQHSHKLKPRLKPLRWLQKTKNRARALRHPEVETKTINNL